jgi:hypothetical protein
MLEIADYIEPLGGTKLTLDILKVLQDHFYEDMDREMHPEDYYDRPDDDD